MVVEADSAWLPPNVQTQLEALCESLRGYCGYRAVWLSPDERLWHAEPDEELEPEGFVYVGCFLRPDADDLACAIARVIPPHRAPARTVVPLPGLQPALGVA